MRARCSAPVPKSAADGLDPLHVEVHVVLPRVADAAEALDALLGERASGSPPHSTWPSTRPAGRARRASAMAAAAKYAVARADSRATNMSASLCLMAWNDPIFTPNCSRVDT